MNTVAQNIRKFRVSLNMTQQELAEKLNTTRTTISNYETGRSSPDIEMLVTISEVFDTSPDSLIFSDTDKRKDQSKKPQTIIKYVLGMVVVALGLLLFSNLAKIGLLSEGFGMFYSHIYEMILPAFVFAFAFLLGKLTQYKYPLSHKPYMTMIAIIIAALAIIWTIGVFIAIIAFVHFYGGSDPIIFHGIRWSGFTNQLFTLYTNHYGERMYLLLYGIAGFMLAYFWQDNRKRKA